MNSTMGPIFKEKVTEKWNLWDPWAVHPCTVHGWLGQIVRLEQKKKKMNENVTSFSATFSPIQMLSISIRNKKETLETIWYMLHF